MRELVGHAQLCDSLTYTQTQPFIVKDKEPVKSHPEVNVFVRFVGHLEHHRAGQEVQGHVSNLRHVTLA